MRQVKRMAAEDWLAVPSNRVRGIHAHFRQKHWRQNMLELWWPSMGWRPFFRLMWLKTLRLAENPHRVALGFAIGVWVSFMPVLGTHMLLGFSVAWLLRGSYLAAFLGMFVGNPWTYWLMWLGGYEIGVRLFNLFIGGFQRVNVLNMLEQLTWSSFISNWHVWLNDVLLPAMVGGLLLGIPVGAVFYGLVKWQLRRYVHMRHVKWQLRHGRTPTVHT